MARFVVTETVLYGVEGIDESDALVNFHADENNLESILDMTYSIDPDN